MTAADTPTTETVEIKNRWTGAVMFTAEVEASLETPAIKIGAAIKIAIKARADLSGADLSGADLARADLARADLAGADLSEANLVEANLSGADLAGADLAGANLARADLAGANLARADLARANLAEANLSGADLSGADLARANTLLDCGSPHGWRVAVVRHADGIRIAAGCRWFTFAGAVKHWRDRENRALMQPLLAYIRAACEIKGWPLGKED